MQVKQTIYVDTLLAVNLFVNYFLLLSVSCFLHLDCSRKRIALGAAAGAVSSLIILLPALPAFPAALLRLALSAAIVAVAFPIGSSGMFLRVWACFYLMSFAFAGTMMAVWYFFAPGGLILKNSVVYFNIPPLLLFALTVACYFAIRGLNWLAGRRAHAGDFCLLTICAGGCEASLPARIDTGNSLKEPFSKFPVVVAEYEFIRETVPDEVRSHLFGDGFPSRPGARIRVIPFHAIGGGGLLPAFRPDKVVLKTADCTVESSAVYVAVCRIKLSETFHALLNPELLAEGRQIDKGGKNLEKKTRQNIR